MDDPKRIPRQLAALGAVLGGLGVALGAFGAHALADRLAPDLLDVYEKAARYQMYHALALLACGWAATVGNERLAGLAGRSLAAGTVVFSGSLYVLALTGVRWLGAITPLGGLLLLAGWALLVAALVRRPAES